MSDRKLDSIYSKNCVKLFLLIEIHIVLFSISLQTEIKLQSSHYKSYVLAASKTTLSVAQCQCLEQSLPIDSSTWAHIPLDQRRQRSGL